MRQQAIRRDRNELLEIQRQRSHLPAPPPPPPDRSVKGAAPASNGLPILAKVALIFWWAVVLVAAGASVVGANLCQTTP